MKTTPLIALLLACSHSTPAPPDARPDARIGSFDQPLGASCSFDEAPLCAGGFGACTDSICRPWCKVVGGPPRCPAGELEHHSAVNGADVCVCVPG